MTKKIKTLVTGGAGFIGSHLVDRLVKDGHRVVVLDNFRRGNKLSKETLEVVKLIEGDVRDEKAVLKASRGCDQIFHFAAVLGVDVVADCPVETMETETLGMRNVVLAALTNSMRRIIYASTSGVYGKAAIGRAVDEEFNVSPSSSYAIAKRFNEIYLKSVFQEKGLESASLRFFNVYGPKQDNRMVIPRFFEQAMRGEPLTVYGTGEQTRDFTYIDDVVEACVRITDHLKGCQIINVSNNKEYTIKQLALDIIKICESRSTVRFINPSIDRYDFEVERRFGSSDKLRSLTGFIPDTPLQRGLERIYRYLKSLG